MTGDGLEPGDVVQTVDRADTPDDHGGGPTTPGAPRHAPRRRPLPGALPVGVIGLVAGCLIAWRSALHNGVFDDTYWHWATGNWMLDHHRVLNHDIYSYTVSGHSWITPEWGYGVLLAESVRLIGPVTFWLLSAGLASLTVIAVAVRCRLLGAGWTWTGLLCVETGVALTLSLDDRPQMVSYFFLALLLLLLSLARRRPGWLYAVPLLFVLWANMHGSFLLGLGVLFLEVIASVVHRRLGRVVVADPLSPRSAVVILGLSALATLVNPFGPKVYSSAFGITFNSTIRTLIQEWQSPNFHDFAILAVVVLPVAITVAYLAFSREDVPALELVLAGFLLVSTLNAVRFLPYFAIAWCALAARCSPLRREAVRPNVLVWPLLAVLGLSLLQGPWWPAGTPAASVPVRAVTFLEHQHGRVFSTYLWNDYLDYVGIKVFVDGRTELYTSTPILERYLDVNDLTAKPDPILRHYQVDYVLWPTKSALSLYLSEDRNWRVVWRSSQAVVLHYIGPRTR
ncbi:MAG TPA: hypothetical protein VNC61_14445 [Acidimicrobiales bacterium]|nr:hypothetical protein [Acidimicrobiales bacterium]